MAGAVPMMRLAAAAAASAAVVLSAPFMGQVRAALRSAFPRQFVAIVGTSVAIAIAAALVIALVRIRDRRAARYGAIAAAVGLGAGYTLAFATGTPEVDVVERVHFVEYGLVTLLFYRAFKAAGDLSIFLLPVFAGVLVGTLEEWFQWFIPVRVGEARDVLLNLVAIGCGLLFSTGIDPPRRFTARPARPSAARIGAAAGVVLLVFAAFVDAVHIGHELADPDIGTFKSRYTLGELDALSKDRAARWRTGPPTTFTRISREDQYMDEALWHIRRRNAAWSDGDASTAWGENLILERHFAPMLDTPTYAGMSGHRWPPEQRADAERRAAAGTAPFASTAEPYPIVTWPRAIYWTGVGVLLALVAVGTIRVRKGFGRLASGSGLAGDGGGSG
jgi:hypothetical protein